MIDSDVILLLSIMFYFVVLIVVSFYVRLIKKASILDPVFQFFIFLTLFVLPLPIRVLFTKEIEGDVTVHLADLLPYFPYAVFMSAMAIIIFTIGYYSVFPKLLLKFMPLPSYTKKNSTYFTIALLSGFSLLLLMILSINTGGLLNFILLGYNSSSETFGKGYLAIGFPWLFVSILFLLYRYSLYRHQRDLVFFTISFLIVIVIHLLMGNRSMVMYMSLVVVIFIHYSIKKFTAKKLILLGLSGFFALNIFGYLRNSNYSSLNDFFAKTSGAYNSIHDTGELKNSFFYTLTTGEFIVPFETLPQMIESVGSEITPMYGTTYLRAPIYYIPSIIFPDRPLPIANWYMQSFYGSSYGLNQGRAFFFLAEGYLNLGLAGVMLIALLWGIIWGGIHRYRLFSNNEPGAILLYALSCAFIFRCIAGDFSSLIVGLPEQSLIPAVIGLLIATGFRNWQLVKTDK